MSRATTFAASAVVLASLACSPAHARRPVSAHPVRGTAPYRVDMVSESGAVLPTFNHRGRFYVLGNIGERYSIRVSNPTSRRVEAVISVDGLDVIDGKPADYVNKRGYVIPPYGDVTIEGFRVSMGEVAAFRFSSVRDSYAGRKGVPRNVGVIGVALFAERDLPPPPPPVYMPRRDLDLDDGDTGYDKDEYSEAEAGEPRTRGGAGVGGAAPSSSSGTATTDSAARKSAECCGPRPSARPGLGTEFGERRGSQVSYTSFERANPRRPTALAEFRYNDRSGLIALGIPLEDPYPDDDEIYTRETADPFPGGRFSEPPLGWR